MMIDRTDLMSHCKTVVIKIGSGVLAEDPDRSKTLSMARVAELAREVQLIRAKDVRIVLVSSGAILAGIGKLGWESRPVGLPEIQAAAAIGQSALMQAYETTFGIWGGKVAQVLLTGSDLGDRERFNNARQTLRTLLDHDVIPIINENDTVATDEITCGDNDQLAALIVNLVEADLLIMLSVMDGLYDSDPRDGEAALLGLIRDINGMASKVGEPRPSSSGRGGIASKVAAAKVAAAYGVPTLVAHGRIRGVLRKLFDGEEMGSLVMPGLRQLKSRKHWIAYGSKPSGVLYIDDGAAAALRKGGTSLLPKGLAGVEGRWEPGDLIEIKDSSGTLVGRGIVSYSSDDCEALKGQATARIEAMLGHKNGDELVHVDNLVLAENMDNNG